MKLLCLVLILVLVKIVTPLYCRCTGANCNIGNLDICYTTHRCFTETNGENTTYGCVPSYALRWCDVRKTWTCCTTDLCNSHGLPPKPYLPVPSVKLADLVKRIVTVKITDTLDVRAKIDGYVATARTPRMNAPKRLKLAPNATFFSFNDLNVNTKYVIEVVSYKGRLTSNQSVPILIKTKSQVCDYYKKGEIGGKKTRICPDFGCISMWNRNGTKLELQQRDCWNDVPKPMCIYVDKSNVYCICNTRKCPPPKRRNGISVY